MKIIDVLKKEAILMNLQAKDKNGIIEELAAPVVHLTGVSKDEMIRVLLERERLGTTGIGGGIGIPHGKMKDLPSLILGFGLSRKGVNFESIDGRPTHIFFLLLAPESSPGLHLTILARISRILKNNAFKERLLTASDRDEVFNIIKEEDQLF